MNAPWTSEAGPELDAKVAEHVMAWEVCTTTDCEGCEASVLHWPDGGIEVVHPESGNDWCPSTSIADTCEALEKLRETWEVEIGGCPIPLVDSMHSAWAVRLNPKLTRDDRCTVEAQAGTLPHAICLAALKAVGVDVEAEP